MHPTLKFAAGLVAAAAVCGPARGIEIENAIRDEAVRFAAKDLARILRDAPGRIVLKEEPGLGPQEWRFRTAADGSLAISGRDGMGIVYGAYEFLEKHARCLWLAPDTEIIPDLTGWRLPTLDERRAPAIAAREMYVGGDWMDSVWRLRNKESVRAAYGVGLRYGRPRDNHTFETYSKIVRAKHPELFGNRRAADGRDCRTLCMTDPRMRHAVAEAMLDFIRQDRADVRDRPRYAIPTTYSLEQDDGGSGGECMCPGCRALFEAEGSYAGPSLSFANAVADEVCAQYPDVRIQWDAYSYTMAVPKTVRASSNVVVRLSNSWYLKPLGAGFDNDAVFRAWAARTDALGIWGYWRTFKGMLDPCVIPRRVIRDEIRFFAANHVVRHFAEDEDPLSRNAAMLQHWLYLKMTDDPSRDFDALQRTFLDGYYGAAAPAIDRFLTNLETRQEASREFLDRAYFETANRWLDEAERLAAGDARSLRHVRWERVVTDRATYHFLGRLRKQGYADDLAKVAARFARNSVEQIETWPEFQSPARAEQRAKRLRKARDEADLYAHFPIPLPAQFAGRDVIALEWNQITLCEAKSRAEFVGDPDAAAGTAFYNAAWTPVLPMTVGTSNGKTHTECPYSFVAPDDPRAGKPVSKNPVEGVFHAVPQDEKFHLHKIGTDNIMVPLYIHFDNPWHFRHYFQSLGILGEVREIWVSMKFQGPTFVKGSAKPDRVLYDRILLVKP